MNVSVNNIQFNYLHRDLGNYKIFGNLVFSNPHNLDIQEIKTLFKKHLIDGQYFYPEKFGIKRFEDEPIGCESDWYEFESLEITDFESNHNKEINSLLNLLLDSE